MPLTDRKVYALTLEVVSDPCMTFYLDPVVMVPNPLAC